MILIQKYFKQYVLKIGIKRSMLEKHFNKVLISQYI
jgi:hypothetical protein